jgi:hypothetical protein
MPSKIAAFSVLYFYLFIFVFCHIFAILPQICGEIRGDKNSDFCLYLANFAACGKSDERVMPEYKHRADEIVRMLT